MGFPLSPSLHRRAGLPTLTVLWLVAVAGAVGALARYELTPGRAGQAVARWPDETTLVLSPDRYTLLVFAHPRCPCTTATLRELEQIIARAPDQVAARVVFFHPAGTEGQQASSEKDAASLPSVQVIADLDAKEARRFSAMTSGHTLLFDRSGQLLFSGGITSSRGHEGENVGRAAVMDLIQGRNSAINATPVFGCPIVTDP
jgi:hypothetical protein